jgi:branched-subunit amino acid aminotransferase/4-amino-4-deoxychorismate lyase
VHAAEPILRPTALFLDDAFVPANQGVPFRDRGLLFGDGVFETLRGHGAGCFRLGAHLARLAEGLRVLGIDAPKALPRLPEILASAVAQVGAASAYVRITVTRGDNTMGLGTRGLGPSRLMVWAEPLPAPTTGPRLLIAETRRPGAASVPAHIKSCNYLPQILAKREAEAQGYDDALMRNDAGALVCATAANVFVLREGTLYTPRVADGCLPGVTRAAVIEAARDLGLPCTEGTVHPEDLATADAVLLSNSLRGLVAARAIRAPRESAPRELSAEHPTVLRIQEAFAAKVERESTPW